MKKSQVLLYVLSGAWNNSETNSSAILGVEENLQKLQVKLDFIKATKAYEYFKNPTGELCVTSEERAYEITDSSGAYAKFYITEHQVELSEDLMGRISRDMEVIDRSNDVKNFVLDQFENDSISEWMYEYITRNEDVIDTILEKMEKWESCNTPYNITLENVVEDIERNIHLNDEIVKFLWEEFEDIAIDNDKCILDSFLGFDYGTYREEVWEWFDDNYAGGVAALMYAE